MENKVKQEHQRRFFNKDRRPRGSNKAYSFYGGGKFKWAIYPDYWKQKWGAVPLLGYVYADDEFYAVREAYNQGLLTVNFTIQPKAVKVVQDQTTKAN